MRGQSSPRDLEAAMEAYAIGLEQCAEERKSFLPKLTAESARLSQKMEAAGIEPASADAPVRASTSLGRDFDLARTAGSRPTCRRASHPLVSRRRRLTLLWRQPVF